MMELAPPSIMLVATAPPQAALSPPPAMAEPPAEVTEPSTVASSTEARSLSTATEPFVVPTVAFKIFASTVERRSFKTRMIPIEFESLSVTFSPVFSRALPGSNRQ